MAMGRVALRAGLRVVLARGWTGEGLGLQVRSGVKVRIAVKAATIS